VKEIELSPMFTSNLVLQQEKKIPVWGKAEPDKTIKVIFTGQERTGTVKKNGSWIVYLDPMKASPVPREMIIDYRIYHFYIKKKRNAGILLNSDSLFTIS
jgi:sialate O-acetylesterase